MAHRIRRLEKDEAIMEFKARAGYRVELGTKALTLNDGRSKELILISDISNVKLISSCWEMPLIERTIILFLKNGKKRHIKRLRRGAAQELYNRLVFAIAK